MPACDKKSKVQALQTALFFQDWNATAQIRSTATQLGFVFQWRFVTICHMPCGDCCGVEEPSQLLGHKRKYFFPSKYLSIRTSWGFLSNGPPRFRSCWVVVTHTPGLGRDVLEAPHLRRSRVSHDARWLIDPGFFLHHHYRISIHSKLGGS